MTEEDLFCHLTSTSIINMILSSEGAICYAAPGIQTNLAKAIITTAERIGFELIDICIDFDERVMRMGYGEIEAVKILRKTGIRVSSSPGLRSGLFIAGSKGYVFTPTALYLEAESHVGSSRNAMRLSSDQVAEALARLSPTAKAIAVASNTDPTQKARIAGLPIDVGSEQIDDIRFNQVNDNLELAPPVRFDLTRQVRVFEPYLQYVELSLTGAAIQHHKLAIPKSIQGLGASKDLEDRLRVAFDLIDKDSKLSSKPLDDALNKIRKDLTRTLGKGHGRVTLKSAKPVLVERLQALRDKLQEHQNQVLQDLQQHLDDSKQAIVDYYLPRVLDNPPDALIGQSLSGKATESNATIWLNGELDRVFPTADSLVDEMRLEERYKDVTFETLNRDDFLESVKAAYSDIDWDKAYEDFLAAGEDSQGD